MRILKSYFVNEHFEIRTGLNNFLLSQAAEACGSLEIDEALNAVKILEEEIREMREAANNGQLRPLPNDDVSCGFELWSLSLFSNFL